MPGRAGIYYVTRRSHRMQKQKIDVTCPGALFVETAQGPAEHEKSCVDVLHPRRTGMH
jgi:hypothetical protein